MIRALLIVATALLLTGAAGAQVVNPTINPATGEPPGAPTGCCCYPKADSPGDKPLCKPGVTEFDCKAECAELKDGRLPSGCEWKAGDCPN
jgi:hypothetical protein